MNNLKTRTTEIRRIDFFDSNYRKILSHDQNLCSHDLSTHSREFYQNERGKLWYRLNQELQQKISEQSRKKLDDLWEFSEEMLG